MSFYMREFTSEEKYDLSKFLNFEQDVYDVLNSPFLAQIKQLPTVSYYNVNDGYREIDLIALDVYGDSFIGYILQFYNNDFRDIFPEGTVLNLFSLNDLNQIYTELSSKSKGASS